MKLVISSGHGLYVRGASGYLDEVDEARRVVDELAKQIGKDVVTFHDDVSKTQNENLNRIVNFHNDQKRDLDVSIHFNSNQTTNEPMGTECLYLSQPELAEKVSAVIAHTGKLKNRGKKKRTNLFFLNETDEPAILIEVCFVDSKADAELYEEHFNDICIGLAKMVLAVKEPPRTEYELETLFTIGGTPIMANKEGTYVQFTSDLDVCNDGSGPEIEEDRYQQSETAYYNGGEFLNAEIDPYVVIPPQIRKGVAPVVMGCQARVTNLKTTEAHLGVVGDIGPDNKTGECAYCLAEKLNPKITHTSGDSERNYLYELWPGVPANVHGKTYKLEPA